jgi:hypothetical protein
MNDLDYEIQKLIVKILIGLSSACNRIAERILFTLEQKYGK